MQLIAPNLIILRVALGSTTTRPVTSKVTTTLRFRRSGDSESNAAPVSRTTQSGTSQQGTPPLPASDSNEDNSHSSSAVIDISEGPSSELLVQDAEKFMV